MGAEHLLRRQVEGLCFAQGQRDDDKLSALTLLSNTGSLHLLYRQGSSETHPVNTVLSCLTVGGANESFP